MVNLSVLASSSMGSFSGGGMMKFMIFSSTKKSMYFILSSSWIFFSSSIALLITHFINCVVFSLGADDDPVFKLVVDLKSFVSHLSKSLKSPVSDLSESESQKSLLYLNGCFHFFYED